MYLQKGKHRTSEGYCKNIISYLIREQITENNHIQLQGILLEQTQQRWTLTHSELINHYPNELACSDDPIISRCNQPKQKLPKIDVTKPERTFKPFLGCQFLTKESISTITSISGNSNLSYNVTSKNRLALVKASRHFLYRRSILSNVQW